MMSGPELPSRAVGGLAGPAGPAGWPMEAAGLLGENWQPSGPPRPMQAAWLASRNTHRLTFPLHKLCLKLCSSSPHSGQSSKKLQTMAQLGTDALGSGPPGCGAVRQRLAADSNPAVRHQADQEAATRCARTAAASTNGGLMRAASDATPLAAQDDIVPPLLHLRAVHLVLHAAAAVLQLLIWR
uniref:Uncharacterized protein n=1 Tax=Macrostomum lignano TaxID=282301 RepID=A0A1I8FHU5_9PLAT